MNAMNSAIGIAAIVGAASGTDAAIWGMYKDAAYEGFRSLHVLRRPSYASGKAVWGDPSERIKSSPLTYVGAVRRRRCW